MNFAFAPASLIVLAFIILMNIIGFFMMSSDKLQAINKKERISEGTIFFLALAGGGIGVYLGMFAFHHKTKKWYFYFGIPLAIIENLCALYLIADKFGVVSISAASLGISF